MLMWQWQMPTRGDYTFPQAPGSEPATFLVILSLGPVDSHPCFSFVSTFPAPCVFVVLLSHFSHWVEKKREFSLFSPAVIDASFVSEALRLFNECKPIYFTGCWWPPSGCLDFLGFALVSISSLIEFRVCLSFLVFFSATSFLSLGLGNISQWLWLFFRTVWPALVRFPWQTARFGGL